MIRRQSKSLETGPPGPIDTTGDTNDISSYIQDVMDICGDFGAVYRLSEKLSTSLSANLHDLRVPGAKPLPIPGSLAKALYTNRPANAALLRP